MRALLLLLLLLLLLKGTIARPTRGRGRMRTSSMDDTRMRLPSADLMRGLPAEGGEEEVGVGGRGEKRQKAFKALFG